MTPGQSQARSSYVIGYRDKALAYPARVGAMAGTPSRIGRNGSGTIERIRLAAGGSEIRTLGPPGCDELASKRAPRTHRFPAEARTPSIGGANSANDLAYSGAACTAFGPIWQPQSPEIARDAGRRSRRGSRYDGSNRREAAAIFTARDDPMLSRAASAASARSGLVRAMRPRITRHSSSAMALMGSITAAEGTSRSSRNKLGRASVRPIRRSKQAASLAGAQKAVIELIESFERLARAAVTPAVLRRRELVRQRQGRNS